GFVTGDDAKRLVGSFGIGVAQGEMELLASDGVLELGWGLALQRAQVLSQLANPGEVLADCDMLAVHHMPLVTRGTRTHQGTPPIRAYVVANDNPLRSAKEQTVERRVDVALVGRKNELHALKIAPGTLATLRAAAGMGGTRLLRALAYRENQASWLVLEPTGHAMEPLGSLRRALGRAQSLGISPNLADEHKQTWRTLVRGHGAEPRLVAEMLEAWLGRNEERSGLLLVDDANEIDSATLDVVAAALLGASIPFRAVARLDESSPLPVELGPLPPGPQIVLGPLGDEEAIELVQGWTGNAMSPEEAKVWANRGGGMPLALGEALAHGLSTGELKWGKNGARSRSFPPQPSKPLSPSALIAQRLQFLTPDSRAVLFAVAVLGGDAPVARVAKLVEIAADIPVDLDTEQERLNKDGWLRSPEPFFLALPSRTHLRVVNQFIPETRRAAWHRAATNTIESSATLEIAEAAWHAVAANERVRAQRIATCAAIMADASGLKNASRGLIAFARAHDPTRQPHIDSDDSGLLPCPPMASSPGNPEDIFPIVLAARGPKRPSRFTFLPVELPDREPPSEPSSIVPSSDCSSLPAQHLVPISSHQTSVADGGAKIIGLNAETSDVRSTPVGNPALSPGWKVGNKPVEHPTRPNAARRPKLELLLEEEHSLSSSYPPKAKPDSKLQSPSLKAPRPPRPIPAAGNSPEQRPQLPRLAPPRSKRTKTSPSTPPPRTVEVPPLPPSVIEAKTKPPKTPPAAGKISGRIPLPKRLPSIHELTEQDTIEFIRNASNQRMLESETNVSGGSDINVVKSGRKDPRQRI
ncbi:MAG: hypothetical protein CSA75_03745, partial [Sorangium cellulosum]